MSKLRYRLFELDGNLVFQVLEMDEGFRTGEGNYKVYSASNGWLVESFVYPKISLHSKVIYLRGHDKILDLDVMVIPRSKIKAEHPNKSLNKIIGDVDQALKEWAENWEGFEECEEQPEKIEIETKEV